MRQNRIILMLAVLAMIMITQVACTREPEQAANKGRPVSSASNLTSRAERGEALFRQFCSNCHPDGANVSDPARNLHRSTLRANGITRPEDIVRIIRNPISRMLRFDPATLPDEDARAIAEYVLEAF